jgi:hypothetical protein
MANFMVIIYAKIAKIVLSRNPDISSPLAFAEGLFCFLNYFIGKEGFLKVLSYIINEGNLN